MSPAPNPNSISGAWRARSKGSITSVQVISEPAIKEVLYPPFKSPSEYFLPRHGGKAPPPPLPTTSARMVYTRSMTTGAAVQLLPPRPPRRVTFDLPGGAIGEVSNQLLQQQHQPPPLPPPGANSVSDIAGVANWLRSRRHNANKESLRIKIAVNRRFSSVQCTINNNNNNYSNFGAAGKRHSLRRYSSIAAIDAKKLPPTVGPPPTASNGGGCFAATSAAAVSLLRCCREGDEAALQDLMTGATGLQLQPADVNCFDATGRTPVSYVASSGSLAMLEALAQFPAVDFNYSDNEGNTPLHFAAQAGHVEVLNLLLSRCAGVEVDSRNSLGFTPLMKAALQGRTKCAKLLLFAGASPALRDLGRGLRAEQWARYCGRHMCAEVIDKFSRHRLLERTGAANAGGRWGSEPELTAQACPPQPPTAPSAHQQASGGSWLKSKLKRAFKSTNQEAPASKAASKQVEPSSNLPPSGAPLSSPHAGTPPMTPRVFIVPKVQVTPAGADSTSATPEDQSRVAANARRKK